MIMLDPVYYLKHHMSVQSKTSGAIRNEALNEYLRCYCCRATIHAICKDYRAAAEIDLEMDDADELAGNTITAPLHVLWVVRERLARFGMCSTVGGRRRGM